MLATRLFVCRGLAKNILRQAASTHFRANACVVPAARCFSTTNSLLSGRLYTDKHEWIQMDGQIGTIGISHYAQEALGDVVYAQLPDVGAEFSAMDECGALESVKAASELYCPLSGKITEKNSKVEDTPGLINQSCYEQGWLFKLQLTKMDELKSLMDEDAYQKFLKSQQE